MNGWLIFLGILAAIAVIPVGASVRYDESGAVVKLLIGPVKLHLLPRPKNGTQSSQKAVKSDKEKQAEADAKEEPIPDAPPEGAPTKKLAKPQKGGSLADFLPLVDVALDMVSGLVGRLRVKFLRLHLTLGGHDPADLAVNYGRAQAAGAALLAQLNRFLVIKKQDVQIQCDFTSDHTTVFAQLELTITVGRAVGWAVGYGMKALFTFLKIKKKQDNQV